MSSGTTPAAHSQSIFGDLLKGTALYTVAVFFQRLAGVILLPLNTRYLNPTDYGVLELIEQVSTIVAVLLGMHISGSLGYFYFEKEDPAERNRVVSTTFLGAALVGLAAALVGVFCVRPINRAVFGGGDYALYLILAFAVFPLTFVLEAALGWLRVVNRPATFALMSALRVGLTVGGAVVLVAGLGLRVLGVLGSNIIASGCLSLILAVYCLRQTRFSFDFALFVRMARFALPLAVGTIGMFVIHFGDRFILPHYRPLADLGIYGIGYKIGMLVSFLSGAFHSYWTAQVFAVVRRQDSKQVIARAFTYMSALLIYCSLGLIVLSRPVLRILTTKGFESAADIVPLIVLAYLLRSIAEFFRSLFLAVGRPGFDAVCSWVGVAVCMVSYFILIPPYGVWGAALATVLTFFVMAAMSGIWTYRLAPYGLELARLVKLTVTAGVLVAAYFLVPVDSLILQLAWGVLLSLAFPAVLYFARFADSDELDHASRLIAGFKARLVRASG